MKKRCENWREYESMAGVVSYCEVAAFNRKTEAGYLAKIGCTTEKREECRKMMEALTGYGLVPETTEKKVPVEKVTVRKSEERVTTMKKLVECKNWTEYDSMGGAIMFCSAAAYGNKMSKSDELKCGCSALKREKCLEAMIKTNGYGLVPEVETEKIMVSRDRLAKIAG